ncbi:MAG: FAD-dependent monooxygenase, partial [Candidatus Micrarchaeota archaeon]
MTKEFDEFDLIVAGCSAAGAFAARDASRLGLKTLVLEEHARSGKQGKCSGLVSVSGLKLLGVAGTEFDSSVVNEVRGAVLHAKKDEKTGWKKSVEFVVERRNAVARVLDRQAFDEVLARQARTAGAKILLNHRVTTLKQNGEGVVVRCGSGGSKIAAKFLIGADGA